MHNIILRHKKIGLAYDDSEEEDVALRDTLSSRTRTFIEAEVEN